MPVAKVCAGAGHTACLLSSAAGETPASVSLYTWGQGGSGRTGHDHFRTEEPEHG